MEAAAESEAEAEGAANDPIKIGNLRIDSYHTIFWFAMSHISGVANMLLFFQPLSTRDKNCSSWPIIFVPLLILLPLNIALDYSASLLRAEGLIYDFWDNKRNPNVRTMGEIWISNHSRLLKFSTQILIIPLYYCTSNNLKNDVYLLRWLISLCLTPLCLSRLHRCRFDCGIFNSFMTVAIATSVNVNSPTVEELFCYWGILISLIYINNLV